MTPTEYAILAALVIPLLVFYFKDDAIGNTTRVHSSIRRISGHLPIVGNVFGLISNIDRMNHWMVDEFKKSNWTPYVISIPFQPPIVAVCSAQDVEFILKTEFENFPKGDFMNERFNDTLGHGIFASDGPRWKSARKTAALIFTAKSFREYVLNVFSSEIIKVYKILDAAAKSQVPIDLQDVFFRYTLDSFGRVGFRYAINSCESRAPFADAFDRMQRLITFRFYNPLWKITELLPSVRKQKEADLKTMNNLITAMLQERKAESEQERSKHSDLLTLFLNAKSETGESYSDEELIDHVKNFMIAGRDTTATALSWIVYNLCKHPVVLEKLMEEIQITTSESNELTYDVIKGMKYANAVFAESLRLYPSVPKNIKTCLNEIKLPSGVVIPAGAVAAHSAYAMGRCKTIWGETAEEFIPERWIDAAYTQFEYPVFNGGPRLCLGKTFAETQGVFALVSILKRYKIELTEPQKVNYTENILLVMRHGLKCQISVRE